MIRSESGKCSGRRRLGLQHLAVIVLADDTSVDHSVPVAGNQSVVTRGAREARHVIDASLSFHYEFIGGNCHPTSATRTSRTEQSRTPAQHKSFANEVCLFWALFAIFCLKNCKLTETMTLPAHTSACYRAIEMMQSEVLVFSDMLWVGLYAVNIVLSPPPCPGLGLELLALRVIIIKTKIYKLAP